MSVKTISLKQTETDIAVLQVQVQNVEYKIGELKEDLKDLQESVNSHSNMQLRVIKEIAENSANAHKNMSEKISALEKWRWMMMGAGIVLGAVGFETLGKLLK